MSSSQSRSRIGCSATRPRSSATTCAARPQARSASMRNSVAVIRDSCARSAWVASSAVLRDVGEQRPAPQLERVTEQGGRLPRIALGQRGPAIGHP